MNSAPQDPLGLQHTMNAEYLQDDYRHLLEEKRVLELRVHKGEERRRSFIHILNDLNTFNHKFADQRRAMIHILADYEQDRSRLARQTEHLDNSRRALMHILQDSHQSNLRLENSRKAMIHIMRDLKETTAEVQHRLIAAERGQQPAVVPLVAKKAGLVPLGEVDPKTSAELLNRDAAGQVR